MSSRAVRFLSQAFDWVTRRPIERAGLAMVLASFFSVPLYLVSKPFGNNIELARTGGPFPGEQSCGTSECHNTTSNSGPGSVSIEVDGIPISEFLYTPGETAQVTVRVQDPAQQRWGFQITVRDAEDGCMSVGSFNGNADTIVRTAGAGSGCAAGREFATHDVAKLGGSSGVFTFDWMAPVADVGPIIFAAAGNAANGNHAQTGDLIYSTSETVDAVAAPPPDGETPSIFEGGIVLSTLLPTVNTISPLSIITVFGTGFGTESIFFANLDEAGRIDTILGGTCVEVDGRRAPIYAMTPGQANVQTPAIPTLGPVSVVMIRNCDTLEEVRSEVAMVTVESATPGFFLFEAANDGLIAARFATGFAAVAPSGMFVDQFGPSRPAKPGEIIVLFGTGWGETTPALGTGERATGAAEVLPEANRMVTFGSVVMDESDIDYVGVTPTTAGLFQLNISVPAGAQPGNNQVVLTVYGKSTPVGPVIPVASVVTPPIDPGPGEECGEGPFEIDDPCYT